MRLSTDHPIVNVVQTRCQGDWSRRERYRDNCPPREFSDGEILACIRLEGDTEAVGMTLRAYGFKPPTSSCP